MWKVKQGAILHVKISRKEKNEIFPLKIPEKIEF